MIDAHNAHNAYDDGRLRDNPTQYEGHLLSC